MNNDENTRRAREEELAKVMPAGVAKFAGGHSVVRPGAWPVNKVMLEEARRLHPNLPDGLALYAAEMKIRR